jgi:Transposase
VQDDATAELFDPTVAETKLTEWTSWASRSQLAPFVRVAGTVRKHLAGIVAYVATGRRRAWAVTASSAASLPATTICRGALMLET